MAKPCCSEAVSIVSITCDLAVISKFSPITLVAQTLTKHFPCHTITITYNNPLEIPCIQCLKYNNEARLVV